MPIGFTIVLFAFGLITIMPVVFYSTADPASANIASCLKENFGFAEKGRVSVGERQLPAFANGGMLLVELDCPLYAADFLGNFPPGDLFVFASKHSSEKGKSCYTIHAPGNWGEGAGLGGSPNELQLTSARALQEFFERLKGNEMAVFREATHHGPTSLRSPSVFVELGSSENEWEQKDLALPVAQAIVQGCASFASRSDKVALGFGGTHYCNAFESLPYAFSHVASKHVLDSMDAGMVKQAIEKTEETVDKAFLDWKGCNKQQRDKLVAAFEENGLEWERV